MSEYGTYTREQNAGADDPDQEDKIYIADYFPISINKNLTSKYTQQNGMINFEGLPMNERSNVSKPILH